MTLRLSLPLLLICLLFASCKSADSERKKFLDDSVKQLNEYFHAPTVLYDGIEIMKMKHDDENLVFTYRITDPTMYSSYFIDNLKESMMAGMQANLDDKMKEAIEHYKIGMKVYCVDAQGKQLSHALITWQELVNAKPISTEEFIAGQARLAKQQCPQDLGNGIVMTDVTSEGKTIIYSTKITSETTALAICAVNKSNVDNVKRDILSSINPSVRKQFTDKGISITYKMSYAGEVILTVNISPQDMQRHLLEPQVSTAEQQFDEHIDVEEVARMLREAAHFPVQVDDNFIYEDVKAEHGNLVCIYRLTMPDASAMANSPELQVIEGQQINDPDIHSMLQYFPIVYRYIDKKGKILVEHKYTK